MRRTFLGVRWLLPVNHWYMLKKVKKCKKCFLSKNTRSGIFRPPHPPTPSRLFFQLTEKKMLLVKHAGNFFLLSVPVKCGKWNPHVHATTSYKILSIKSKPIIIVNSLWVIKRIKYVAVLNKMKKYFFQMPMKKLLMLSLILIVQTVVSKAVIRMLIVDAT